MIDPKPVIAVLLLLAALAASWRSYRREGRASAWPVWAQPVFALLLFALLFPPRLPVRDDRLTVLVAGSASVPRPLFEAPTRVVAMPESDAPRDIERLPDLATALRRNPSVTEVDVVGDGLALRDQDAIGSRSLRFHATPERGLVLLQAPADVAQGTQWTLSGKALPPAATVELRDPAGITVDTASLARGDGGFRLSALARSAGNVGYELRFFDEKRALVDTASVPIRIHAGEELSAIVRAGAPDPEFKYWRRWAADAGISVQASAGLSDSLSVRDGDVQLTPDALAARDFVIIDERAWPDLKTEEKTALSAAVANGLGLLLRITGPLSPEVASDWATLGFRTANADRPRRVTIDRRSGLRSREAFTAAPVTVEAGDARPMIAADDGEALAMWRAEGQGRIGVWRLVDSYRLGLIGEPARYASLWQSTLATLTRARPQDPVPPLPQAAWVDERSVLCGLGEAASVQGPDAGRTRLVVTASHCAAYWPVTAGWHRLQTGAGDFPFYVRAADDARGLHAARDRAATLARVADANNPAATPPPMRAAALPRWPIFLVWLLLAALLWWRERPR